MKKSIYSTMFCLAICFIMACGEKKITVKGADGTEYESYQECCAANDYEAAHQYLAKMKNTFNGKEGEDRNIAYKEFLSAKEEVFNQESLFLMSQDNADAQKRIIYLLKEYDGNADTQISKLIDIAIDNDDEDFVKKLANQLKGHYNAYENIGKVVNYLSKKTSKQNKEFLVSLCKKMGQTSFLLDLAMDNDDKEYIEQYISENDFIQNTKLLNYLAAAKNKKYNEMIIGKLTEKESQISKKPQMGFVDFHGSGKSTTEFESLCDSYISSTESFNQYCQNILGIAIKNGNQYLAQRVVTKFRTNINVVDGRTGGSYKITTNNEEVKQAQATYQNAVRSGAFR